MSRLIQYKTIRSELFLIILFHLLVYEVIQHYNAKKEGEKQCIKVDHRGIDPGPLVQKSDTLTTRSRGQIVRGSK